MLRCFARPPSIRGVVPISIDILGLTANCSDMDKTIEFHPVLKPHDGEGPVSFIYFDEEVELPDGSRADVQLRFDNGNSFEEMRDLIAILKEKGLRFYLRQKR